MIVHEVPPYLIRVGGEWQEQPDGRVLLVGGQDQWVQPPPEWHADLCPCQRCEAHVRALESTQAEIESTEVLEEYKDPELTPEDLERLKGE